MSQVVVRQDTPFMIGGLPKHEALSPLQITFLVYTNA